MLREYQEELIERLKYSWKTGHKRPCIVLPCGGGKSVIVAEIAKRVTHNKRQVLFIVHRLELCQQISNTFKAWGVDMNYCMIGMVQTVSRRLDKLPEPGLIIVDENHHVVANTYTKILNRFPKSYCVGVTATPVRLNSGGLGDINDDLIVGVSAKWLIANGYLAPYKYYSVPVANFSEIRTVRGDYDITQLSGVMENDKINGDRVANYRGLADGRKTIIYCASVKAAKETANEFCHYGYKAAAPDGAADKSMRAEIMDKFRTGNIDILTNCELFGEGLDIQDVDCVILLRKTKSLTLFIQQSMRCMRTDKQNPNKTAIIIDHVGNIYEHGFPDDDREWWLQPTPRKSENTVRVKECHICYAVLEINTLVCPYCECDFTKEVHERQEKERVEAELVEISNLEIEKYRAMPYSEYKNFEVFSQLDEFRKAKGYKIMWAVRKALELGIYIPEKYRKLKEMVV